MATKTIDWDESDQFLDDTAPEDTEAVRELLAGPDEVARDVLMSLVPSMDPDHLRAELERAVAPADSNELDIEQSPVEHLVDDDAMERDFAPAPTAFWPLSTRVEVDAAQLAQFCEEHSAALGGTALSVDEVKSVKFQTVEDGCRYVSARGGIGYHTGRLAVSPPLWRQFDAPAHALTHTLRPEHDPANAPLRLALFSDFGNGTYQAKGIARQLVRGAFPYAFHLGDVYYRGSYEEVDEYLRKPLASMLDTTELFLLAGNHELYAKGIPFQNYITEKHASNPRVQRQNGESFRLKGPGFQVIGIDTMWIAGQRNQLRKTHLDSATRELLQTWLDDGESNELTILLTSDHAWHIGKGESTQLFSDVEDFVRAGKIHMWFWGNVHYGALYKKWTDATHPQAGLVASCIGHGGYPFYTMRRGGQLPRGVELHWLEEGHRFWPYPKLRSDVGLNGWCELGLRRTPAEWQITLTYRDWVGRDRLVADIRKAPNGSIGEPKNRTL